MKQLGTVLIALLIALVTTASVPVARADEKPSAIQTALSNTTLGGGDIPLYVDPISSDGSINIAVGNVDGIAGLSMSFSPSSVPEPSSIGLFAVGAVGIFIYSIANQRRRFPRATGQ